MSTYHENRKHSRDSECEIRYIGPDVSSEGELDVETLSESITWRMGFLAGYCAETNEPHSPEDFRDGDSIADRLGLSACVTCGECGLSIERKRYHRLIEVANLRDDLDNLRRMFKMSVDGSVDDG